MLASRRWRDWTPELLRESAASELTKPTKWTSVSFVSADPADSRNNFAPEPVAGEQVPPVVDAEPPFDPAARGEDFGKWALTNCVFRDRCFGGIAALHTHFCEWTIAHDSVRCRRETFEQLLTGEGFLHADGMVYGLLLKEDWESAHAKSEPTPRVEPQPTTPILNAETEQRAAERRATLKAWDERLKGAA